VELGADKLLVITGEDVRALSLPHYLPLVRVKGLGLFVRARGALGWLPGCLAAWLPGCLAACLPACLQGAVLEALMCTPHVAHQGNCS
jgi:hypothetical protein